MLVEKSCTLNSCAVHGLDCSSSGLKLSATLVYPYFISILQLLYCLILSTSSVSYITDVRNFECYVRRLNIWELRKYMELKAPSALLLPMSQVWIQRYGLNPEEARRINQAIPQSIAPFLGQTSSMGGLPPKPIQPRKFQHVPATSKSIEIVPNTQRGHCGLEFSTRWVFWSGHFHWYQLLRTKWLCRPENPRIWNQNRRMSVRTFDSRTCQLQLLKQQGPNATKRGQKSNENHVQESDDWWWTVKMHEWKKKRAAPRS